MQKFIRCSAWSLLVAVGTAVGVWTALFVVRAREQQRTIEALREIEVVEYLCVLPAGEAMSVPAGAAISRSKVTSPVEFAPHGPDWLRRTLGEDRCREWIDTPVAVNLAGSEAGNADLPQLACFAALKKLDLFGTKVTANGFSIVRRLPALEELSFGSEGLTDGSLDGVERLKSLRALMLYGHIGD